MKHLLLYEAFKSKGISKTLKYLSDSDIPKEPFLEDLKNLLNNYDVPISDLNDNDIHYTNKRKAKNIIPPDDYEIMNTYGIYTIKFWFSVSDGYLGSSVLIDKKNKLKNTELKNTELSDEDILYAEKELGLIGDFNKITTENISGLKTGDVIVGRFRNSSNPLKKAIIYKEDNGRTSIYYAIQNQYKGNTPDTDGWKKYGTCAWYISDVYTLGSDSYDLHHFKQSDNDEIIISIIKDPDIIKNSDFCLVIYLDDLIHHDSVIDIRGERAEIKSGALALMDPEEIKSANYKRYMNEILKKMGIYNDSKFDDLKSLEKIVQKVVVNNWALFSVYCDEPRINYILDFSESIKTGIYGRIIEDYNIILSNSNRIYKKFKGSSNRIKSKGNKESLDIIQMYYDLSRKLNQKIKESNLETLEDLILINYKLSSLNKFLKRNINFSDGLSKILNNFYYDDYDVDNGIEGFNNSSDSQRETDINSYKLIDRFIDKLF